jgi:hypothetical protein
VRDIWDSVKTDLYQVRDIWDSVHIGALSSVSVWGWYGLRAVAGGEECWNFTTQRKNFLYQCTEHIKVSSLCIGFA